MTLLGKAAATAAVVVLVALAGPALAGQKDGTGKDGTGPPDPTANIDNVFGDNDRLYLGVGESAGGGLGAAVAVGDEGDFNSLFRVGVALGDDGHLASVYFEDYTTGNFIYDITFAANSATNCILVHNQPGPPGTGKCNNEPDATLITLP